MDLHTLKSFIGWCTVFNYVLLIVWSFVSYALIQRMGGLVETIFGIRSEKLLNANFYGIVAYKLCVFFLNLIPFVALCMIT